MMLTTVLIIALATEVNAKFLRICDGKYSIVQCSSGKIKIKKALYGRQNGNVCPSDDNKSMSTCEQQDVTKKLKENCDDQNGCFVRSSAEFLGVTDTCENTKNYLDIKYYCIQAVQEVRQCEDDETVVFKCGAGYLIKVLDAYWGRYDQDICHTIWYSEKGCSNSNTFSRVKKICDGERSCEIKGEWFGNPCTGPEFFEAKYVCVEKVIPTKPPYNTKYLCGGMSTLLRCFDGVLNIVDATFGRQNTNTCNKIGSGSTSNTDCQTSVTEHIKFSCQNKRMCIIVASAGQYGDPCPGTSKYLKVNYKCQPKGTYQPPTRPKIPPVPTGGELPPPPIPKTTTASIPTIPKKKATTESAINSTKNESLPISARPMPVTMEPKKATTNKSAMNSTTTESPPIPVDPKTAAPQVCGTRTVQQSRVINGVDAEAGAWPWQIALYSSSDDFMCGGTLLNPFWIVTAAHCVNRDPKPSSYYIVLGDTDRTKIEGFERRHGIANIIVHEDYGKEGVVKHDSDIAMIKLERPAFFNSYISPACLPIIHPIPSTNCFITGWGKIIYPGYSHTMLQQANIEIVTREKCENKLKTAPGSPGDVITTNMICANSNNGRSGCQGDSGGPFVCQDNNGKWVLRGVVSWGSPRCHIGDMYSVFVDVSKFVNWIHNVIRDS